MRALDGATIETVMIGGAKLFELLKYLLPLIFPTDRFAFDMKWNLQLHNQKKREKIWMQFVGSNTANWIKVPRSRQSRCECGQFYAKRFEFYFHFYDDFLRKTFPLRYIGTHTFTQPSCASEVFQKLSQRSHQDMFFTLRTWTSVAEDKNNSVFTRVVNVIVSAD